MLQRHIQYIVHIWKKKLKKKLIKTYLITSHLSTRGNALCPVLPSINMTHFKEASYSGVPVGISWYVSIFSNTSSARVSFMVYRSSHKSTWAQEDEISQYETGCARGWSEVQKSTVSCLHDGNLLTSIAGLVHVFDLDLTIQILIFPCQTCLVYATKQFG